MLTDILHAAAAHIWDGYHTHPFVTGIGDGTLPKEKFQFYMIQDYLYLYEYAKVFALGVAKSTDHTLMRTFADMVHATLNGEMTIHESYMKRLNITNAMIEQTKASFANAAYTSYMLKTAYEGDVLDILTAILSCAWSYEEIGRRLAKIPGASEHPFYGEWITSYASDDYAQMNRDLISTVNQMGQGISKEKEARLVEIFKNCSIFEGMFWDMSYEMQT